MWKILKGAEKDTPREDLLSFDSGYEELGKKMEAVVKAVKHPGQWKDIELIEAYNENCDSEIIRILSERSKNRAFVVYKNEKENIIDVDSTLRLLREARRRETPVHYKVSDVLKKLYKAGEFPSMFYFESPFAVGVLLFDGYCEKTKQSWNDVDYEVMQFARIALELQEAPREIYGMRQFINIAKQEGINGLIQDYPETYLKFKDAKEEGSLPILKKRVSDTSGRKIADPLSPGNMKISY